MYRKLLCIYLIISCISMLSMSCDSTQKKVKLVYDAQAGVGEGALWDDQNNRLLWIDITGKTLYLYYPESAQMHSYPMPQEIGTVVPLDSSTVVLALAKGIFTFNIDTKVLRAQVLPDIDTQAVRFNDGKCAPDGTLWVGTMDFEVTNPIAALYKVGPGYSFSKQLDSVTVSNGIIWSVDGTKMYYIDSPTYTVAEFDYDVKTGTIANKKIIINTPPEWGTPDGATIDEEGMLWIAHWGKGRVSRWNPNKGILLDTIIVPAPHVTSLAFGGVHKDILYITTARNWMQEGDEEKYPKAGGLFAVKPGVKGISSYSFQP